MMVLMHRKFEPLHEGHRETFREKGGMMCRYRNTRQTVPAMVSIVPLHQNSSSSMFMVKNTLPSKHGMKGPRWMENWIAKFKSKLLPIIGAQVRKLTDRFSPFIGPRIIQKIQTQNDRADRNLMDWTHVFLSQIGHKTCPLTCFANTTIMLPLQVHLVGVHNHT